MPQKKVEPQKKPEFNIDISKKNTISEKANDFGFIKSFEEESREREAKKSNTMEFTKLAAEFE